MAQIEVIRIEDTDAPALQPYGILNETQLKHYYEPHGGLFIAETMQVIIRALDAGYQPVSFLAEERYLDEIQQQVHSLCVPAEDRTVSSGTIPVYTAPLAVLTQITGYHLTRGILAMMERKPLPTIEEICLRSSRLAILDDVTNPTNVGAIFRSAAALGMDGVLLTPDCSDPLYRRSLRVSLGTVCQIPWTIMPSVHTTVLQYHDKEAGIYRKENALYTPYWPEKGMEYLRKAGFKTAAMALSDRAVPIDDLRLMSEKKLAVILGNEGYGLSDATLSACDYEVIIPMAHGVDSLNVAAASAVAFWQLRKK